MNKVKIMQISELKSIKVLKTKEAVLNVFALCNFTDADGEPLITNKFFLELIEIFDKKNKQASRRINS